MRKKTTYIIVAVAAVGLYLLSRKKVDTSVLDPWAPVQKMGGTLFVNGAPTKY